MNKFFNLVVYGILIGSCMILPGVSGSVIAIMLGVYDDVILLLSSNKSNIYKIKKLLPLVIGLLLGIFIFGKILLFLYDDYSFYMMYVFIGLILGSIPILISEIVEKKQRFRPFCFIAALLIALALFILPIIFKVTINDSFSFFNLFIGGFLYIGGKIIPGISSSFFLMVLGLYEYVLTIITDPFSITISKLISLIPFLLGILIGLFVFIKLINYLLKKYFSHTYSSIIGFVIGSVFCIYPGFEISIRQLLSILLMVISYILVSKITKK